MYTGNSDRVRDDFCFSVEFAKKQNCSNSRLLFLKRNRMLSKLPPASKKDRREFEQLFTNDFWLFSYGFYLLGNEFLECGRHYNINLLVSTLLVYSFSLLKVININSI